MLNSKLKPCPFCGNTVNIMYNSLARKFFVYHDGKNNDCAFEMSLDSEDGIHSLAEAYKSWNTRKGVQE